VSPQRVVLTLFPAAQRLLTATWPSPRLPPAPCPNDPEDVDELEGPGLGQHPHAAARAVDVYRVTRRPAYAAIRS
jgi:hypothetical protein